MENAKLTQKSKSKFAFELLGRISSYLDPNKIVIILALAIVAGLLGFLFGSIFVEKADGNMCWVKMDFENFSQITDLNPNFFYVAG